MTTGTIRHQIHIPFAQVGSRYCGSHGLRSANQAPVGYRVDSDGLLEQPVEEQTSVARCPAVETKRELVEVVGQVRSFWPALMGAEQPSLEERRDAMDTW